jgi:hypothetical protein
MGITESKVFNDRFNAFCETAGNEGRQELDPSFLFQDEVRRVEQR